jgi:hypothetical protein
VGGLLLSFSLWLQDLSAFIFSRLEVDMVRPAALARLFVFDICGRLQRIRGTPRSTLHARNFLSRDGHSTLFLAKTTEPDRLHWNFHGPRRGPAVAALIATIPMHGQMA